MIRLYNTLEGHQIHLICDQEEDNIGRFLDNLGIPYGCTSGRRRIHCWLVTKDLDIELHDFIAKHFDSRKPGIPNPGIYPNDINYIELEILAVTQELMYN